MMVTQANQLPAITTGYQIMTISRSLLTVGVCDSRLQGTIDRPTVTSFYTDRQDNKFFNSSIINHDEEILSSTVCQSDFEEQLITQLSPLFIMIVNRQSICLFINHLS